MCGKTELHIIVTVAYLKEYVYLGRGKTTCKINGPTETASLPTVCNPSSPVKPGLSFPQVLQSREEKELGQMRK